MVFKKKLYMYIKQEHISNRVLYFIKLLINNNIISYYFNNQTLFVGTLHCTMYIIFLLIFNTL